jgi:hypothetical protein
MGTLEEGKQIQAQAYATASIQPLGLGPASNGLIYFFSALVTIVLGLRVYVRFFSRKVWGWDDLLAIAGYVRCPIPPFFHCFFRFGSGKNHCTEE